MLGDKLSCCALIDAMKKTCYIKKEMWFDYILIGGDSVRSYVYETVKLSNTKRIVTRYTLIRLPLFILAKKKMPSF